MKYREVTHHGNKRYLVQYTVAGSKKRKFFKSKTAAGAWIAKQESKKKELGRKVAKLATDEFIRQAIDLSKKLEPFNATIESAVQFYIQEASKDTSNITIADLRTSLIGHMKADKDKSPLTIKEVEKKTQVFMDHFGPDRAAASVTSDMAREWLNGLNFANRTTNHYRTKIGQLYNHGITFKGLTANPLALIPKRKVRTGYPGIFTTGQMKTMLDAAKGDNEITAWIAIGAYAGIRPSEIERLEWQHIHIEKGVIEVPETITRKSTKMRTVDIRPKLKKILQSIQQVGGPVVRSDFSTCKRWDSFKDGMKFKWTFDGLRHSFGTYHLRAFRHAGETSLQMGHGGSPKMLQDHYDNPTVTKDEALKWWAEAPTKKKTKKRKAQ